jgi:hypothetical protein
MDPFRFIDDAGVERKRKRMYALHPRMADLDHATQKQLRQFVSRWDGRFPPEQSTPERRVKFARLLFPDRPIGFVNAAVVLHQMARRILDGKNTESLYKRLPVWARFRDEYSIKAARIVKRGKES